MLTALPSPPLAPLCSLLGPAQPAACHAACHSPRQQLVSVTMFKQRNCRRSLSRRAAASTDAASSSVLDEKELEGMSTFLDSLKWDANGLVTVVVQVSSPP